MRRLVLIVACTLAVGCYRTHYANFSPDNPLRGPESQAAVRVTRWQHFFIWGWAPGERRIDATALCGDNQIDFIDTRRTFLQGLIGMFAGYYINVYSPWNGAVYCIDATPPT